MNSQIENLNEMDDLKDKAPKLSGINRGNPFGVPKNYFDDFYARLEAKIEPVQIVKKPNAFIRYLKPAIGLAAGFALVFSLVYWPLNIFTEKQTAQSDNTEPTIENEYIAILENVDDNSLFALLENGYVEEPISDDELVGYLSTNLSDYEIYMETSKLN